MAAIAVEERFAVHAGMSAPKVLDDLRTEAEATRQSAGELVAGLDNAETVVASGRPSEVLRSVAEREEADLIAVGTHGTSRPVGLLIGSVATTMLNESPCTVLIARAAGAEFPSARRFARRRQPRAPRHPCAGQRQRANRAPRTVLGVGQPKQLGAG
jgi:hypothetical protein